MLPGVPALEDYDSRIYDDFWRAAIEVDLPLSFHVLTTNTGRARGPKLAQFLTIMRGNQDIMGMLLAGRGLRASS